MNPSRDGSPLLVGVAFRAGVLIRMAGKTAAFVDHSQSGVASVLERRQGDVASGQLVMAPAAVIGGVAGCTAIPVNSGVLTVNIVSPAGSVRRGDHDLVAGLALREL